MRVRLLILLILALVATACRVDNSSVTATPSAQSAQTTSSIFATINEPQPPALPEDALLPVNPVLPGTAVAAAVFVDPGPGLAPSERCGFDVPVTIGRIGLDLDIVIVAPTEHFDSSEITETLPDAPATVEKGIICLIVHDRETSSVSCGVQQRATGTVAVRHEALPVTMVLFLAESTDKPVALPEIKLWDDCDRDNRIDPLDIAAEPNRPVESVPATVSKDLLSTTIDTLARFYVAQDPDEGPYRDEQCAAVQAVADGQWAAGTALLAALGIDFFWQPLPSGELPDPALLAVLDGVIDEYSSTIVHTRLAIEDDPVFGLAQIAGLSSFLWSRVATVNVDHEQRDDERFPDHVAWQIGGVAASGLDHFEMAALLEAVLVNRCTAEQLAESVGAWAARGDDSSEICTDLVVAYQARSRFRSALDVDPAERRELLRYMAPADRLLDDLRNQYPGLNDNPFFSNEALSGFYYAEYSLARRVDDGNALREDEVSGYETKAAEMHDFARENCPSITNIDLPSVFELVPETDPAEVERARVVFCADFSALLNARNLVRGAVDDQPGLQPFTPDIAQAMAELSDRTDALVDRWPDEQVLLDPNGGIYRRLLDLFYEVELLVRQANFEPIAIPIPIAPDGNGNVEVQPTLTEFVLSTCPDIERNQFAATVDETLLPGPTVPALPSFYITAAQLCPVATRAVEARAGFRDAVNRHLAGDPHAYADALGFRSTFVRYAGFDLSDAFAATFPESDSAVGKAFGTTEGQLSRAFEAGTGYDDTFLEALELMPTFVSQITSACPAIDASAFGTAEQTQALYEQFGPEGAVVLPNVLGVADLCAVLDQAFKRRALVRIGVENADNDAVDEASGEVHIDDLYSVEEFPEGFTRYWISGLESAERSLYYRLEYNEPQSKSNIVEWDIRTSKLVAWARSNCPQISVGLDLPSVGTVFSDPDQADVDRAQAEICAAIDDLFDARVAFRSYVDEPQDDFPLPARAAYLKLLAAATVVDTMWADEKLLVDPDGDRSLYSRASQIARDESIVRQAYFGPLRIPMTQIDSGDSATNIRKFAQGLCDDLTESASAQIMPLSDLTAPAFAPLDSEPTESQLAKLFCQSLEVSLLARLHLIEHLRAAVQDPDAGLDATAYFTRLDDVSYGNSIGAAFTEAELDQLAEDTTTRPATRGLVEILGRVATSAPTFDDRWDIQEAVTTPEVLDQIVIDRCTRIPAEAFDLSIPDGLQLFDALTAR